MICCAAHRVIHIFLYFPFFVIIYTDVIFVVLVLAIVTIKSLYTYIPLLYYHCIKLMLLPKQYALFLCMPCSA